MDRMVVLALMFAVCTPTLAASSGTPFAIALTVERAGIPPASAWGERGAVVADVDADGRPDLLVTGGHALALVGVLGTPAGDDFGVRHVSPMLRPGVTQPGLGAVAWCAPRGPRLGAAIHVAYGSEVDVLTGWPLVPTARFRTSGIVSAAVCDDVDADGADDLVVAEFVSGSSRIAAYDPWDGSFRWASAGFNGGLRAAQLDADPALEIIAGTRIIDGATRALEASYAPGFGLWTALGNLDADPLPEFVAADFGSIVTAFDTAPFSPTFSTQVSGGAGGIATADVVDGAPDEIIVAARQGSLQVRDAAFNSVLASFPVPPGSSGSHHPRAADFDADGRVELAWATGNQSSAPDALAWVEPASDASVSSIGGTVGPYWSSGPLTLEGGVDGRAILAVDGSGNSALWLAKGPELQLQGSIDLPGLEAFDVESADLAEGAGDELIVGGLRAGSGEVRALRADGSVLWVAAPAAFNSRRVVRVLRARGASSARDDMLAIAEPNSTNASGTVAVLLRGIDGIPEWTSIAMGSGFSTVAGAQITEFDGDGRPELVLSTGGFCWVFDIGTRLLDASFSCTETSARIRELADGVRQWVGFDAQGNIVLRSLPGFDVIATWQIGEGLRVLAPIPPFTSVFLYATNREVGAINMDTGQSLTSETIHLGPAVGGLDRARVSMADALGSTITLGAASAVFDLRVSDDGLFRDGFEDVTPAQ